MITDSTIAAGKLAGNIPNSKLANDSITITDGTNSTDRALGQTITFTAGNGITVAESSGTVTFTPDVATAATTAGAATKGLASFHSDNFDVSSGFVSLKANGIVLGDNTTGDYVRSITPGIGLTGGNNSGEGVQHTLNVGGLTVSELAAGSLQLSSESFSNDDTSLMTSAVSYTHLTLPTKA